MELIEGKSLIWAQKGKLYIIYENVMWILGILTFKSIHLLFYTFMHWFAESMFFVGVHWMAFGSHVKFRQLQTQRLAYQNNTFSFATRLGWLATEFYDYRLSISLPIYFFKIKFVFFLYLRLSASWKENDIPLCRYFWYQYQIDSGYEHQYLFSRFLGVSILQYTNISC
jgi:hypothetical protein